MIIYLDAQLSPNLAEWIGGTFSVDCKSVRDIGLRDAEDEEIFEAARKADAIVMTKDADFAKLLERKGPPPRVLWITCGNTSNASLKEVLQSSLRSALTMIESGEALVEISSRD